MKGKVKEQWGKLTDDDLNVLDGRRDQLEGKIQSATVSLRISTRGRRQLGIIRRNGNRQQVKAPPGLAGGAHRSISTRRALGD